MLKIKAMCTYLGREVNGINICGVKFYPGTRLEIQAIPSDYYRLLELQSRGILKLESHEAEEIMAASGYRIPAVNVEKKSTAESEAFGREKSVVDDITEIGVREVKVPSPEAEVQEKAVAEEETIVDKEAEETSEVVEEEAPKEEEKPAPKKRTTKKKAE